MKIACLPIMAAVAIIPAAHSASTPNNDYPTQARVEYVIGCMKQHKGENYDNMYHCVCAIDKIAAQIPYADFVANTTLAVMINTSGEKSGVFRDGTGGRKAVQAFKTLLNDAEVSCGLPPANP